MHEVEFLDLLLLHIYFHINLFILTQSLNIILHFSFSVKYSERQLKLIIQLEKI